MAKVEITPEAIANLKTSIRAKLKEVKTVKDMAAIAKKTSVAPADIKKYMGAKNEGMQRMQMANAIVGACTRTFKGGEYSAKQILSAI